MNSKELISSFTDTIIVIASEANGKDPETQRKLILQVIPFFNEILANINQKSSNIKITKKATSHFLMAVSDCIQSFLQSKEDTKQLATFLEVLVSSCLAPQCSEELTRLMTSLVSVQEDPENCLPEFFQFIQKYFKIPEFRLFFTNSHGFETVWCAFFIEKSNVLIPMFFEQFAIYPADFTSPRCRTSMENLLNTISSSLSELPFEKCELIITKLFVLCRQRPIEFYNLFVKVGMFDVLCKFVFNLEESKKEFLISYLITFSQIVPFEIQENPSKPLTILMNVVCDPKCAQETRSLCINFFLRIVEQRKNPFKIEKIGQMAISIPHDDHESIISFSKLCFILQTDLNFDLSPIIPTLIQFCTYKLMTTIDLHNFLLVFIRAENGFSPYISSFFIPLFQELDSKQIVNLFDQYNELYSLFSHFVSGHLKEDEMIPLLRKFLIALPLFEDKEKANSVFWDTLLAKKGYLFINTYLTSIREIMKNSMDIAEHTFSVLIKCALTNAMFCLKCISDRSIDIVISFYTEFHFSTTLILNFIAAITMHRYIPEFDDQVSSLFKQYDYLNESPDNLLFMTLGLQNGQDKKDSSLCFPSILHRCTPFEFSSPFDLWLCGQISLDLWLEDQKEDEKDISRFPSIVGVARQYIQPKHAEMIIQKPLLLEKVLSGPFSHIPVFEFPGLKCEALLEIPLINGFKSFSFWICVPEFSQPLNNLITINSLSLSLREDKLIFEGKQVGIVNKNAWNLFVFNFDESNGFTIFMNEEQIHSLPGKNCSSSEAITFGSKYNTTKWYIGGTIRIFKETLSKNKIKSLFQDGPKSSHQTVFKEIYKFSSYDIVPLFSKDEIYKIQSSRPVTVYSIYHYIKRSLNGALPILIQSINMIDDKEKLADISALVSVMCSLQKLEISGWSNSEFSLFMSILLNIRPEIANRSIIDKISNCFLDEGKETFDWESFLDFSLDYSFFFSDVAIHLISLFFEYNVRFPIPNDSPMNIIFTNFLLSLIVLPDIKQENLVNIYDLLQIHCKNPNQIIRVITSYPDFANDLQDYSSFYEMKTDDTIKNLLNVLLTLPINNFTEFYILRLLDPIDSFKLLEHIIVNNFSRIEEAIDSYKILSFCFENISYIQSWEISLSIFLKRNIRLDDIDFDYGSFNMTHFKTFIRFLVPLVFIGSRLSTTNFWNRLCVKLLSIAVDLIQNNPNFDFKIKSKVLLMMTLGVPLENECIFPPGPSLHSIEDVLEYSTNRGQIFPNAEIEKSTRQPDSIYTYERDKVINLANFVPNSFYLTPNDEITMDLKLKELSYVIIEKQTQTDYIKNWDEYLERLYHNFGIENPGEIDVENSNIVSHLSQFLIQILRKNPSFLDFIISTTSQFPYKLSVYWMQHLSIEILQLSDSKDLFGVPLVSFVCNRLLEGWYSSLFLIILSSVFSILQQKPDACYSDSIFMCILYSMDLVHSNQVSMLGDLFVEYENVILRPAFYEKLKYVIIFITRGISLIPFLNKNFTNFWNRFLDLIESSDIFQGKWNKKIQFDLKKVIEGLRILGREGFVEYTNHKNTVPEFWESFDSFLQQIVKNGMIKMKETVKAGLDQLIQLRRESNQILLNSMNKILSQEHSFNTYSRAIAASVRYFTRRCVLTKCELFLRKREKIISTYIPFNESNSERYSLTILSDPIYPSRRKTKSPLEYVAPPYPSGTSDVIFEYHPTAVYEYSAFPECVSCCLSTCRYRVPSILRRSPNAIHARFAESLHILPSLSFSIFLCICNEGKKFDYMCDCSLLYGVDVLEGTLFINSKNLIFLEGNKIRDGDKMFHIHSSETRISQEIYMQFIQSKLLAPKIFTFDGHFAIVTEIQQIISATNHLWIQRPYSVTLNYSLGYNFVLNFSHSDYNEAMSYINKGFLKFMESAPPDTLYISPIHSVRLISDNIKKATSLWTEGEIDNFTYLSVVNRYGKRCFADLTQYPVFPWVISDYTSDTFPPQGGKISSSPSRQIELKKPSQNEIPEQNENQPEEQKEPKTSNIPKLQKKNSFSGTNSFDPNVDEAVESEESESFSFEGPSSLPINKNNSTLFSSIKSFFVANTSESEECDLNFLNSNDTFVMNDDENALENEKDKDNENEHSSHIIINDKLIYRDLTKPMGQLDEERAKKFDQIYEDSEHLYYYGTHYLHFGVVVYFMFRIDPFSVYSFILHRGWDHPNRIFLKVNETWLSASMKSQSDVKELVPQMYKVPDYLTNVSNFNFETKYDKINVAEVELPKWAANDRHFIQVMCRFLESRYVSKHLNSWIDLIFGVNSRGQGAINTKNIFHPTCYPESANINDENEDILDKQAKVTSIINFGQISPQVFTRPHPQGGKERKRQSSFNLSYAENDPSGVFKSDDRRLHLLSNISHLVFQKINCELGTRKVQDLAICPSEIVFAFVDVSSSNSGRTHIGLTKNFSSGSIGLTSSQTNLSKSKPYSSTMNMSAKMLLARKRATPPVPIPVPNLNLAETRNISSSNLSTTNSAQNSPRQSDSLVPSNLCRSIVLPSFQVHKVKNHTVSSIGLSRDGFLLCKTFLDGHIAISRLNYSRNGATCSGESEFVHIHTKNFNLGVCDISSEHYVCFVASGTSVLMIDVGMQRQIFPSIELNYEVKHISIDDEAAVVWIAGGNEITLCTISGDVLYSTSLPSEITSVYASPLPEYAHNRFACVGSVDGSVSFLNFSYRKSSILVLYRIRISENPIMLIKVDAKAQRAIAVCSDNEVYDFEYIGSNIRPLDTKYSYECANCKSPIKGSYCCSCCNRFLCSKCVAKDSIKGVKVIHFCQLCNPIKSK